MWNLENIDLASFFVLEILIYCEVEHEGKEDSCSSQKMPNVVSIVEIQQQTVLVQAPDY